MKIFYNGNIFAPGLGQTSAFVVGDGCFLALGSDAQILDSFSHIKQIINLEGHTVWPGLIDSHLHLQHLGASRAMVNCETETLEACLYNIEARAKSLGPDTWIRGHGWNQNRWQNAYGTAQILDQVSGNRPAYLTAKSLHAAWVNTRALDLAGIDAETPNPPGGAIQRDASGEPTGILFEAGGMALIEDLIPEPTQTEIAAQFEILIPELWQFGLVGVHDFDGMKCWEMLKSKYQNRDLKLRVRKNIPLIDFDQFINENLQTNAGDDWLQVGNLKLFADGALGPQTAAMFEPYENSNQSGTLLLTEDEIFEIGVKAVENGIALSIHAIGDLANHTVLNAYERLRKYESDHNLPHLQHRIEHVQTIRPEDILRLATLDIVASVQPIHATSDMEMADCHLGQRAKNAYTFKSLIQSSAPLILGSDAPVETANPFAGLHAAVTRQRLDGTPSPDGWYPDQRLTIEEAVAGYSLSPHVVSDRSDHLGKIAQGYKADFLVLNMDPLKISKQEIASVKPLATFIEGDCVYKDVNLSFYLD
jgi:predicted amidohydrolase YtcJ